MSLHGTVSRYNNGNCRCDLCRIAVVAYSRNRRAIMRAEVQAARERQQALAQLGKDRGADDDD